jgi:peptidoglycan hydrolase-like protein with peptidoglycan-binding domain
LISRPVCRSCGRRTDASRPSSAANGRSGGGDRDRDRDNLSKDDIRWAQIELHNLGLYNGSLDGVIGPETERALLGFQKSNGLEESALASRLGENSCPSQSKNQRLYRLVSFPVTRSAVWAADCVSDTGAGGETTAVSRAASPRQWYLARMVPTT